MFVLLGLLITESGSTVSGCHPGMLVMVVVDSFTFSFCLLVDTHRTDPSTSRRRAQAPLFLTCDEVGVLFVRMT